MKTIKTDVAVIGGGPGGSTLGAFLRKHSPDLKVSIFEREVFPRDHVGESQLPFVCKILAELGVWDRVEAAGFPIKVGATYRWGKGNELWDFDFLPAKKLVDETRPAQYQGQRTYTAFQVDRAIYDKILIDYAQELGCNVQFGTQVQKVLRDSDRVVGLQLEGGTVVEADYYVDASGHAGILRRAMDVPIEVPTSLQNIAIWDYWHNADWADHIGIGGTRIQILSLGYGWIWFIPLGPSRTSIGFVCPAEYYKKSGITVQQLYENALASEPRIQDLIRNATCEKATKTTKDWSFLAGRMSGENWLLVGEAMGFADPILSAGLTLTHASARELAFLILEEMRGGDKEWLRQQYCAKNEKRLRQHIRFADYWYRANAHFSELKEFTSQIARDAGLELSAERAFQWLGTGGFVDDDLNSAGIGYCRMDHLHQLSQRFSEEATTSAVDGKSMFILKIHGSEVVKMARFEEGRVQAVEFLSRDGKQVPLDGLFGLVIQALAHSTRIDEIVEFIRTTCQKRQLHFDEKGPTRVLECLEALIRDGWVKAKSIESFPTVKYDTPFESSVIRSRTAAS
jgi:flavin-dependent dehydrogenase